MRPFMVSKAFYRSRSDRSCAALPNMDRSCGEQFHAHVLFRETPDGRFGGAG